jgi:hypothetical protein
MAELVGKLQDSLDKWDIVSLTSELQKTDNAEWIENNAWDLVPILVQPATEENLQACPQVVQACCKLLAETVAKLGQPKEIIIAILEACEHDGELLKLKHCLPSLLVSLVKLNVKAASLIWPWALTTILDQVTKLDPPEIPELEGSDRLMLDSNDEYADRFALVQEVHDLLQALKVKYDSFIEEQQEGGSGSDFKDKCKLYLLWACVRLLGRPLASMEAREVTDGLVNISAQLALNPVKLIELCEFSPTLLKAQDEDEQLQIHHWHLGVGKSHCIGTYRETRF